MNRQDLARRKREIRARRHSLEALSGGWGRPAQEAGWDAAFPRWRPCLRAIAHLEGEQATAGEISELSRALNAAGRRLAKPWYRLLMQTMQRHHDETLSRFGRWGGYPLR